MDDFEVDLLAQAQKFLPVPHINHEQIAYICSLAQELGRKAIEEVQIGQLKVDILKVCAAAFESESSPQLSWFYRWKRMQLAFLSHPGGSEAVILLCAVYFLFHLRKALSRRRPVAIEQAKAATLQATAGANLTSEDKKALALITSTGSGSRRLSRTKETEEEESAI